MKTSATCPNEISEIPSTRLYCWDCSQIGRYATRKQRTPRTARPVAAVAVKKLKPVGFHFSRYKKMAKDRRIKFDLSIDQFSELWKKPCTYCGQQINTIGVDRIDSKRGYTTDNITPCCGNCNWAKRLLSVDEYIQHCRTVALHNLKADGG